ncbi:MAG: hypothetical protein IPP69_11635 [Flavobacteriales bacterium]|nr:hypothetical protein [Flavobacteriales bacterium]
MKYFFTTYLMICTMWISAQDTLTDPQGVVTFVTSQSVYVKFENTDDIEVGDTLKWKSVDGVVPCLIVKNKSSASVVCIPLNKCAIQKGEKIYFDPLIIKEDISVEENPLDSKTKIEKKERYHGRVSAASFSNITEDAAPSHRTMYRLTLNADHIHESKFSFETFLNYRQLYLPPEKSDIQKTSFFNIYNLAVSYQQDSTFTVTVGRKINNKASSLGAIDGLQLDKSFGKFYTGIILGFRPDFSNYGFNSDLPEFGGYVGLEGKGEKLSSRTTLGLLQQNNSGAVDRRYVYFQHSSTFYRKFTVFTSSELDLFNEANGKSFGAYRLTNFYSSLNYRVNKKLDLNVSYDSRKQIMYYETYSTDIERMLDDDQSRQGVRGRIGIRPTKYTSIGVSVGKRFQSSNQNKSDNLNAYISYTKLPGTGGRLTLNYNVNRSLYLLSEVVSIRLSQDLFNKKLNAEAYVRKVNYSYYSDAQLPTTKNEQYYYGLSLMHRLSPTISFSVLGEMTKNVNSDNYRVNLRLMKRFDSKKKKKVKQVDTEDRDAPWKF